VKEDLQEDAVPNQQHRENGHVDIPFPLAHRVSSVSEFGFLLILRKNCSDVLQDEIEEHRRSKLTQRGKELPKRSDLVVVLVHAPQRMHQCVVRVVVGGVRSEVCFRPGSFKHRRLVLRGIAREQQPEVVFLEFLTLASLEPGLLEHRVEPCEQSFGEIAGVEFGRWKASLALNTLHIISRHFRRHRRVHLHSKVVHSFCSVLAC
jgi:hypothetical protein